MNEILNPGIIGFIEGVAEGAIKGWAFNPSLDEPVMLSVIIDGWEVATTICDAPRPDIAQAGFAREHVGFHFDMPATYFDGATHVVQIRSSDNCPVVFRNNEGGDQDEWSITLSPEYSISCMDAWQGEDVHCWAVIVDRLMGETRPADFIIVRQSGRKIATLLPTISRADVAELYNCHHLCGFVLPYYKLEQLTDAAPLHFYVNQDGREIPGSPLDLSHIHIGRPQLVPLQRGAMVEELSWDMELPPGVRGQIPVRTSTLM